MNADIFFYISSVGFIVIFILVAMLLIYVIGLVRSLHDAVDTLKEKAKGLEADAEELLEDVRDSVVFRLLFGKRKKHKKS